MSLLKIKDNRTNKKILFSDIPKIVDKVANKTLEQLERAGIFIFPEHLKNADDLTKDQMILQEVNDSFRTGNIMGFIGCGNERLIIESRFSQNEDYFFQYLLDKVLNFPNIVDLNSDSEQSQRLFNFLIFLFPHYLKTAMRKGIFKKYIRQEYNNDNIRGTVDITRHIKLNTPFIGNVAYNQREFSCDNYVTEIVRHTIEFIRKKSYGKILLAKVKDEVRLIAESTPKYRQCDRQKIIETNKKNILRHAYFREYILLQRLCILILQNRKYQTGSGTNKIYGILFDGAWLWEEYVNSLIKEKFYHPMNKKSSGAQRLFSGNSGIIYPDFISCDTDERIIADAKYKPLENIGNKDYLQLLAYMFRFDAKKGYYLYPEVEDIADCKMWLNSGSTFENNVTPRKNICVTKHGLKIPINAKNYEDFLAMIKSSEFNFLKIFI